MVSPALTPRSKNVDGVHQEISGTLTAYDLSWLEIAKAALVLQCESAA